MRGNKYVFRIKKNCKFGSIDSGRNPNVVPITCEKKGDNI